MAIEFRPKTEPVKVSPHKPAKVGRHIVSVSPGGPTVWINPEAPKKGRPSTGKAKKPVTLRLDQDVVAALEAREDWRTEVNTVLRKHLGL